jgi:hypothetical protein
MDSLDQFITKRPAATQKSFTVSVPSNQEKEPNTNIENTSKPDTTTGVIKQVKNKNIPKIERTVPDTINAPIITTQLDPSFNIADLMASLKTSGVYPIHDSRPPSEIVTTKQPTEVTIVDASVDTNIDTNNDIQEKDKIRPVKKKVDTVFIQEETKDEQPIEQDRTRYGLKTPAYYNNNREKFIQFINQLFTPYKEEMAAMGDNISCDSLTQTTADFSPLIHQKIVKDYLNNYTPYPGLLLYHGLGSGKTCTSIGVAEGMKDEKHVMILTPASLRMNYMEELKKCGSPLYKKNQHWEWVPITKNPERITPLSISLGITESFIRTKKGAWVAHSNKPANYSDLSTNKKKLLNVQIDAMIANKYSFVHYNGLTKKKLGELTQNFTQNPFDNKVVVVDEAHNLVSRIVNKIRLKKKSVTDGIDLSKESIPIVLYEYLLSAKNCRTVILTGTPVVNYANEMGIMFNILRKYIKTWRFQFAPNIVKTEEEVLALLNDNTFLNYIKYESSSRLLTITKNPYGFTNKPTGSSEHNGVEFTGATMTDAEFEKRISDKLKAAGVRLTGITSTNQKLLPDTAESFNLAYIDPDTGLIKNADALKRRIMGLTSFFKSAQESLLPRYTKTLGVDYHVEKIEMSDSQFIIYELYRQAERKTEKPSRGGNDDDISSTYRIFSRLFCNFIMDNRPMPEIKHRDDEDATEKLMNKAVKVADAQDIDELRDEGDEMDQLLIRMGGKKYKELLEEALISIRTKDNGDYYLSREKLRKYSPKFLKMLDNIQNPNNVGLHLVYSQFRTLEGIAIFSLVLEYHGFARLKIHKNSSNIWSLDVSPEDMHKPKYALYTGTESAEEREIIRNIFNGDWKYVPSQLSEPLLKEWEDNSMGDIIKVLMITASGSEGINLRNTRFVHIMEPYWHPVRTEQVIGRARRICSHVQLPLELQTVEVFIYIMSFSKKQISSEEASALRRKDISKINGEPISSDEYLYEISEMKNNLLTQITNTIKESSFDCFLHNGDNCVNFSNPESKYSYVPNYKEQESVRQEQVSWTGKKIVINGVNYIGREINKSLYYLYDPESYSKVVKNKSGNPLKLGTYEIVNEKPILSLI